LFIGLISAFISLLGAFLITKLWKPKIVYKPKETHVKSKTRRYYWIALLASIIIFPVTVFIYSAIVSPPGVDFYYIPLVLLFFLTTDFMIGLGINVVVYAIASWCFVTFDKQFSGRYALIPKFIRKKQLKQAGGN
jgi:hypothetical protein